MATGAERRGEILVLLDGAAPESHWGTRELPAALRHLGVPYRLWDLALAEPDAATLQAAPLILLGQEYLGARLRGALLADLLEAVAAGTGLVSLDGALHLAAPEYLEAVGLDAAAPPARASAEALQVAAGGHWIVAARPGEETLRLRRPLRLAAARPREATPLAADAQGRPVVWATTLGSGRLVQWAVSTTVWAQETLGFAAGLDDLLWRGIAWAARKPFLMKPMPSVSRLRLDDCRGLWRDAADFAFVDVLNRHGHVPTLCLCLRAITPSGAARLHELASLGKAEFAPHTLAPDVGLFLGEGGHDYGEQELRAHFAEIDARFGEWGLPISSVLSDHNHELSAAALPFLRARGIVHRMNITAPGERWEDEHLDWSPAPYGLMTYAFDEVPGSDLFAVFNHFSDFAHARTASAPGRFLFDRGGGFGDVHWDFLNGLARPDGVDLAAAAERLARHDRRGLESRFFGGSISHSHHTQYLQLGHWEELLAEVERRNGGLGARPLGYDQIACLALAHARTELASVSLGAGEATVEIRGRADLVPRLQVLAEPSGDEIRAAWVEIGEGGVDGTLRATVATA